MCGIVGFVGEGDAVPVLLNGLKKLEYRGYDSAGLACVTSAGLELRRAVGKLAKLEELVAARPLSTSQGVGHTRWATHGRPNEANAHPHTDASGRLAIVHNGIVENYLALRAGLQAQGVAFRSETDSEVLAHLIESYYQGDLTVAVRQALADVHGAYAIVVLHKNHPDLIVAARKESPLIIGLGDGENFVASDIPAILHHTRRVVFLENLHLAEVRRDGVRFMTLADGTPSQPQTQTIDWNPVAAEKGGFSHFMLKEIFEQPEVIRNTIGGRCSEEEGKIFLQDLGLTGPDIYRARRIVVVACGTAYYAGCVGKYLIEKLVRVPVECDLASEFRYREPLVDSETLVLAISQSGETADTLAAVREAKARGAKVIGIVNAKGSTLTREVDGLIYIHAGPEIGVASTKAYIAMLTALTLFALLLGKIRTTLSQGYVSEMIRAMKRLPQEIEKVLTRRDEIRALAAKFHKAKDFLFLGRGVNFPTALEGALKLKEISYIHAEAYAAGEMKHGPIALIDEALPVFAIATASSTYEKLLSNLKEVQARSGILIALATEGDDMIAKNAEHVFYLPACDEILSPILTVVPLQLFAYYCADYLGLDVDQPRNLAKSVTVE